MKNVEINVYYDGEIYSDINTLPFSTGNETIIIDGDMEVPIKECDILMRLTNHNCREGDILLQHDWHGDKYGVVVYDNRFGRFVSLGLEKNKGKKYCVTMFSEFEKCGSIFYNGTNMLSDDVKKKLHLYFNTIDKQGNILGRDMD